MEINKHCGMGIGRVWEKDRVETSCEGSAWPSTPQMVPVFSSSVLGVLGLFMISTSCCKTISTYGCISEPEQRDK